MSTTPVRELIMLFKLKKCNGKQIPPIGKLSLLLCWNSNIAHPYSWKCEKQKMLLDDSILFCEKSVIKQLVIVTTLSDA